MLRQLDSSFDGYMTHPLCQKDNSFLMNKNKMAPVGLIYVAKRDSVNNQMKSG